MKKLASILAAAAAAFSLTACQLDATAPAPETAQAPVKIRAEEPPAPGSTHLMTDPGKEGIVADALPDASVVMPPVEGAPMQAGVPPAPPEAPGAASTAAVTQPALTLTGPVAAPAAAPSSVSVASPGATR